MLYFSPDMTFPLEFGTAAVKMIHDFCGDASGPVSIKLKLPYRTTIEFSRPGPGALPRILDDTYLISRTAHCLQLCLGILKLSHRLREAILSVVFHILTSISPLLFHMIRVSPPWYLTDDDIHRGEYIRRRGEDSFSIASDVLLLCSTIDDALADRNYESLVRGTWYYGDSAHRSSNDATLRAYNCNDALCRELFPKLAERDIFDGCNGECGIHQYVMNSAIHQLLSPHPVFV